MCFGIDDIGEQRDGSAAEVEKENNENKEARQVRMPVIPYRPTKREIEEHCVSHWPFRPWCRHCGFGRAQGHPHRSRGSEGRKFGRAGPPTISMDHCFLGSAADGDSETAHGSPFLVIVDNASEAIYCVACSTKGCTPWVVEYVHNILSELGYSGMSISMKCDQAPELKEIRKQVAMRRSAPTVPIDVPVREAKGN